MRLTLYYMTRTLKNQIRKLFRTWVAIFLVVCIGIGVLFGLGAAALSSLFEEEPPSDGYEETLPDGELPPDEEFTPPTDEEIAALVELFAGAIVLVVLFFSLFAADKNGGSIFLMADVNLLFPAPLKPQSVLLFRLIMQAAASIAATIYLLFQLPNLILNLGLDVAASFAIIGAWVLLMIYGKLLSVLLYTLTATYPALKRYLRPVLWGVLAVIGGSFYLSAGASENYFVSALDFFNAPASRYVPIWGWLKGLVAFAMEKNLVGALLMLALLIVGGIALIFVIWRIKADFYEDAMARSAETAEAQQALQEAKPQMKQRKKDRADRLRRDGLSRGNGASVYFYKTLYNRFRFAHLRVFTKTSETYLAVALGVAALLLFVIKVKTFIPIALTLGGFVFFRSLGNPISADVAQESFFMVPDTAQKKVFYSFLGGVVNGILDLLPAFLVSALVMGENPLTALVWMLLIVSLGCYSDAAGLFIDLSLSTSLSATIRSIVQIMFVYFGLAPAAVLIILGFALDLLIPFVLITVLFNLAITALSLGLSPLFVEWGRR